MRHFGWNRDGDGKKRATRGRTFTGRHLKLTLGLVALFAAGLLTATGAFGQVLTITGSTSDTTATATDTTAASTVESTTTETTAADTTTTASTTTDTPTTTDASTTTDSTTTTTTTTVDSTPSQSPTIASDQADYAPGATVTLTGAGWGAGEKVHLFVNDAINQSWQYNSDVIADLDGSFTAQLQLPSVFVSDYTVTATGAAGQIATTTFTDGNATGATLSIRTSDCSTASASFFAPSTVCAHSTITSTTSGTGNIFVQWLNPSSAVAKANSHTGNPGDSFDDTLAVGATGTWTVKVCTNSSCNTNQTLASATFTVIPKQDQTITFAQPSSPQTFGATFNVNPTASSGLAVTVTAEAGSVCTVAPNATSGWDVTMTAGTGNCVLDASQPGNAAFNAAPTVTRTVAAQKASTTTTLTCPAHVTYDGSAQTPCLATVTGAGGLSQAQTVVYAANMNAGTASASATFPGDADHTSSGASTTFVIDRADTTATVSCQAGPFTYTGSAQTPCTAGVTGAGGLNQSLSLSYSDNTDAGTATASAAYAGDANHNSSSDSTTFTIGQASSTTTVTCTGGPFAYTGLAQTPCSATATGVGGLSETLSVDYTNNTDAGTATASAAYGGDANHTTSSGSKDFTIAKASSETAVTCTGGPFTYTGVAQTPCTAALTGAGGLHQPLTVNYSDNVDAGTASASASFAGDANHDPSGDSDTFDIGKADSTTVVSCPTSVTYDSSAQEPCTAKATGVGGLSATPDVSYANNTDAGSASASASYAGDANHKASSGEATFTIDPAASTTTVTCAPLHVTFDGDAQTPCSALATGVGGVHVLLTVGYSDNVHAGTATASASYGGDPNHLGSEDSTTFVIDRAGSTVKVDCPTDVTYNGSAQEPCTAAATGAGELDQPLTVHYSSNTDAGMALATATFDGDDDHTGSDSAATFAIDRANATITVSPYSVTYDGELHTATGSATGVKGEPLDGLSLSGTTHTNAGTYNGDTWTFTDVTGNYNDDSGKVEDVIDKADAHITVTPYSVTYNGETQTATGSATGAKGEALAGLSLAGTTHTNAGTYNGDTWTFTDVTGNYNDAHGTVDDSIAKANATITVTPYGVTYDGDSHTATGSAKGVESTPADLSSLLDLSGTTHTKAGDFTDSWTFAGDVNYNNASGTVADSIAKANATITVTPYHVTYDGAAHTANGSATGVKNEALTGLDLSATGHTNADAYAGDEWTFTDVTGNYNDAHGTVDDSIAKADATIVVTPYAVTYTGDPHTATGSATGVESTPADLSDLLDLSGTTHTNAGTYSGDTWSFSGNGNYNPANGTVKDSIAKADADISVTPYKVTYDGEAHTADGSATGVKGETLAGLDLSGTKHTNAHSYAGDPWTFTDVTGNYNDDSGTVDDAIDKADARIVVTGYSVTYNGGPHTATGSATGVESAPADLSELLDLAATTHTNAGGFTDSWTFAGNDNYNDASGTVADSIAKAAATIAVTPYTTTYNGAAHTATGSATGVKGEALAGLDLSGTTHTSAGTYSHDSWAFTDVTGNYKNASGTVDDSIAKADADITVTPYSVTYNGAPHTATGSAKGVEAVPADLFSLLDLSATTHTNANTYAGDPWSFAGNGNYNPAHGTVDDAIAQANADCSSIAGYSVTYNGDAHTAAGSCKGVDGTALAGLDKSGTTHTDAGTFTGDAWTFVDVTGNYKDTHGTVDDSIDQAAAKITVTPYSVIYDGASHVATGSATGVKGESLAGLDLSGTMHTDAGAYTGDTWTFVDATGNYNATSGNVDDSIGRADANVTVTPYSTTYDGAAHTAGGSAQGVEASPVDLSTLLHLGGTTHTNVGIYSTDGWTFDGNKNYKAASGTITDTIGKATTSIAITWTGWIYDGTAHAATAKVTGPVAAENPLTSPAATLTYYAGQTATGTPLAAPPSGVGYYTVLVTFAGNDNYNGSSKTATVQVTYNWQGFLQPINDTAHQVGVTSSVFKDGSTVPVKFQLKDAAGHVLSWNGTSPAPVFSFSKGSSMAAAVDETLYTGSADSGNLFRWDPTGQQWIYNWSTKGLQAGYWYRIYATLDDGSKQWVDIGLR